MGYGGSTDDLLLYDERGLVKLFLGKEFSSCLVPDKQDSSEAVRLVLCGEDGREGTLPFPRL